MIEIVFHWISMDFGVRSLVSGMLDLVNLERKCKSDIRAADNFAALDMNRHRGIACSANPWKERQPVTGGVGFDAGRASRPVADRSSAASTH